MLVYGLPAGKSHLRLHCPARCVEEGTAEGCDLERANAASDAVSHRGAQANCIASKYYIQRIKWGAVHRCSVG